MVLHFPEYEPQTPSASFYAFNNLDAVAPKTGGEARFLHVVYNPPLALGEKAGMGELALATLEHKVTHPLVDERINAAVDFNGKPMGVVHILDPFLNLTPIEGALLTVFDMTFVSREDDTFCRIGKNTITIDADSTRAIALGPRDAERVYRDIPLQNIIAAAVSAIVLKRLTIDNN